jgi:hypothetical protein
MPVLKPDFTALCAAIMTRHLTLSRLRLIVTVNLHDSAKGFGFWLRGCQLQTGGLFFIVDILIPENYIGVKYFLIPIYMKRKMGRPKLPKGEAKAFQIGVRFNRNEAGKIRTAVAKTGLTNADWARNVLIGAAGAN